jgi:hypothetical protein
MARQKESEGAWIKLSSRSKGANPRANTIFPIFTVDDGVFLIDGL